MKLLKIAISTAVLFSGYVSQALPPQYQNKYFASMPAGTSIILNQDIVVLAGESTVWLKSDSSTYTDQNVYTTYCYISLKNSQPKGLKLLAPIQMQTKLSSPLVVEVNSNKPSIYSFSCGTKLENYGSSDVAGTFKYIMSTGYKGFDLQFFASAYKVYDASLSIVERILKSQNGALNFPEIPKE